MAMLRRFATLVVLAVLATVLNVAPVAADAPGPGDTLANGFLGSRDDIWQTDLADARAAQSPELLAQVDPSPKTVLLLVGDPAAMTTLDLQIDGLLSPEYEVTVVDDNSFAQMVPTPTGLRSVTEFSAVIFSPSTDGDNLSRFAFKADVPILALKPASWGRLGLVPLGPGGTTSLQDLATLDVPTGASAHPIVAGLPASFAPFDHPDARAVAAGWANGEEPFAAPGFTILGDGPDGVAAFVYDPETPYALPFVDVDDLTSDCRVGLPANKNTEWSAAGITLFMNAMSWLTSSACGVQDRPTVVSPALAQRMCTVDAANEDEALVEGVGLEPILEEGDPGYDPNATYPEPNLSSVWVRALVHDPVSNTMFVGGRFQNAFSANGSGFSREGLFACDLDTGQVSSFEAPIEIDPYNIVTNGGVPTDALTNERVRALAFDGQYLYVGGKFAFDASVDLTGTTWDDRELYNLFRIDVATNQIDLSWAPNVRGGVSALEIHDQWLYVAGGVWHAGGEQKARLTRVRLSDGFVDPSFTPMFIPDYVAADGTLFASVLALDVEGDTLLAAGSFEYVAPFPDAAAWTLHASTILQGQQLTAAERTSIGAQRRNSVVAIDLTTGDLTPFSPSIGDNNLGADEIAQIKDVVSDGQGHVYLCGDWWLTAEQPNNFWTPFRSDPLDGQPPEANPNSAIAWEGQVSKYQPRPNQHNFGKFHLADGASVMVDGAIWGATTDGGVQACDYDAATDTLIVGGHYESIGAYDPNYVDTATPENNYPDNHVPLEKANSIDGETGEVLPWDPDVDSVRGLDAVRVFPAAVTGESIVAIGGAYTTSDREDLIGLSMYRVAVPREPDVVTPPEWELHRFEAATIPATPGAIDPVNPGAAPAGAAQGTPWAPGPDPDDAAGQIDANGVLGQQLFIDDPAARGALAFAAAEPTEGEKIAEPTVADAQQVEQNPGLGWNTDGSTSEPVIAIDVAGFSGVRSRHQIIDPVVAAAVSPLGAAAIVDIEKDGANQLPPADFDIELDVASLPIDPASDIGARLELVWHSNCAFQEVKRGVRGVVPEVVCEAENVIELDTVSKPGRAVGRVDVSAVREKIARSPLRGRNARAADFPVTETGEVLSAPVASPTASFGLSPATNRQLQVDGGIGGADMMSLRAGNVGPNGNYGSTPVAPNATYQVGEFVGSLNLGYGIEVPAPFAGPAPAIGLSYSSAGIDNFKPDTNNQSGPIGVGWSLGAGGAVSRSVTGCGDNDLCPQDEFSISLAGTGSKLVKKADLGGGRTEYRLEIDPMWRVIHDTTTDTAGHQTGDHWEVTTPDGTTHYLGKSATSVQWVPDEDDARFAVAWHISYTEDVYGNRVTYIYDNEIDRHGATSESYVRHMLLDRVEYTTNFAAGRTDPQTRIRFNWEARCGSYAAAGLSVNGNNICEWEEAEGFIDTPKDLFCPLGESCQTGRSPAFWSARRLGSIQVMAKAADDTWRTLAVHDLLNEIVTPPEDADEEQAPAKMALRGVQRRPGGDYWVYGFSQIEAELFADPQYRVTTSDQGGGLKSSATSFNIGRTYLGATQGSGHAKGVAVRYSSDAAATVTMTVGGQTSTISLPSTQGLENFQTVVLNDLTLRGSQNVSFSVSSPGTVHVNWFRFYADAYNHIPGQPPVRYDQAPSNLTPILNGGLGAADSPERNSFAMHEGFIFLNNRVLDGEPGHTSMRLPRIAGIVNETGGRVRVRYGHSNTCERLDDKDYYPGGPEEESGISDWADNERDCFPSYNTVVGHAPAPNVFNKWKVRRVESDTIDGGGNEITSNAATRTDYNYFTPRYARASSLLWEDFRGHSRVDVVHKTASNAVLSKTRTYYFQGLGGTINNYGPDSEWLTGRPRLVQQFGASGNWVTQTRFSWNNTHYHSQVTASDGGDEARFVATNLVQVSRRELGGTTVINTSTQNSYDAYGRVVHARDNGRVLSGDPTATEDNRSVLTSYATNVDDWILSLPCDVRALNGTAATAGLLARTTFVYQGSTGCDGTPSSTRVTDQRAYWSTSGNARTRFTYDAYGRVIEVKDPRSKVTTTSYDPTWGLADQVTNHLGWGSGSSFDNFGRVVEVQGPNGDERTTIAYDDFHRVTSVTEFADRAGAIPTSIYEYRTEERPPSVKTSSLFDEDASIYISSRGFVDGFGRAVQEVSNAEEPGKVFVVDRSFDARGNLAYATSPTLVSGDIDGPLVSLNKTNATSYSESVYDGLGRVVRARELTGNTVTSDVSTTYDLLTMTRRDSNHNLGGGPSNTVTTTSDVYGNLLRVQDATGADTHYTYDDLNRLRTVTDVAGNETEIFYDQLSRKTKLVDPDTGTWRYTYDASSNLRHQWNEQSDGSRLFWNEYTYDGLNRPRIEYDRSDGRDSAVIFTWDVSGSRTRRGELMQTTRREVPGVSTHYVIERPISFDEFGRVTRQDLLVNASDGTLARFKTQMTTGAGGQLLSYQYPGNNNYGSGDTITYSYNERTGAPSGAAVNGTTIVDDVELDAFGRVTYMSHGGSGLERSYSFDPVSHRLTNVSGGADGDLALNLDYTWDDNSNLVGLVDHTNSGQLQCFGYDDGQRLVSASTSGYAGCGAENVFVGNGGYSHEYSYDALGNITSYGNADRVYTYGEGGAGPHAVTSISNGGLAADWVFSYDGVGNQVGRDVGDGVQSTVFGWDQTVESITSPDGSVSSFLYDASDGRVRRETVSGTTWYVGGYEYEVEEGSGVVTQRLTHSVAGVPVAVDVKVSGEANTRQWLFGDHLGSVSAFVEEGSGDAVSQRFYPFGHERLATSTGVLAGSVLERGGVELPTDVGFTGQVRDDSTGLLFYNARYYDPVVGRFTQADTIIPNPANPVDLNRYAYVRNSPLIHTDPSGHCTEGQEHLVQCGGSHDGSGASIEDSGGGIGGFVGWISGPTIEGISDIPGGFADFGGAWLDAGEKVPGNFKTAVTSDPTEGLRYLWAQVGDCYGGDFLTCASLLGEAYLVALRRGRGHPGGQNRAASSHPTARTGPVTRNSASGVVPETPVMIRPLGSTGDGIFTPGPYADASIPARGPQQSFTAAERSAINEIGATSGCHRCGATVSGRDSGNFTPDHMPVTSLNPAGAAQRLYPHCAVCSPQQGGYVSAWLARWRAVFGDRE